MLTSEEVKNSRQDLKSGYWKDISRLELDIIIQTCRRLSVNWAQKRPHRRTPPRFLGSFEDKIVSPEDFSVVLSTFRFQCGGGWDNFWARSENDAYYVGPVDKLFQQISLIARPLDKYPQGVLKRAEEKTTGNTH